MPQHPSPADPVTPPDLPAPVAAWRRAEERLYPVVAVDPDHYRRVVSVIRATADRLGTYTSVEALVGTHAAGPDIVRDAARSVAIDVAALGDLDLIAGAAFHLRYGELVAEQRRREIRDRIEEARRRGAPWVVLSESGRPDTPWAAPYERVEMRLADGAGMRVSIEADPSSYAPRYGLEPLALDAATGRVAAAAAAGAGASRDFDDRDRWEAELDAWRRSGLIGA